MLQYLFAKNLNLANVELKPIQGQEHFTGLKVVLVHHELHILMKRSLGRFHFGKDGRVDIDHGLNFSQVLGQLIQPLLPRLGGKESVHFGFQLLLLIAHRLQGGVELVKFLSRVSLVVVARRGRRRRPTRRRQVGFEWLDLSNVNHHHF